VEEYNTIFEMDLPDIEKLARAFEWVTGRYVGHAQQEIELIRALGDQESLVKEQIKLGVMKHARSIFYDCYRRVTGRKVWDE